MGGFRKNFWGVRSAHADPPMQIRPCIQLTSGGTTVTFGGHCPILPPSNPPMLVCQNIHPLLILMHSYLQGLLNLQDSYTMAIGMLIIFRIFSRLHGCEFFNFFIINYCVCACVCACMCVLLLTSPVWHWRAFYISTRNVQLHQYSHHLD